MAISPTWGRDIMRELVCSCCLIRSHQTQLFALLLKTNSNRSNNVMIQSKFDVPISFGLGLDAQEETHKSASLTRETKYQELRDQIPKDSDRLLCYL